MKGKIRGPTLWMKSALKRKLHTVDNTKKSIESKRESKGEEVREIIVVGGGVTGMIASIEASRLGASVVLLEENE